MAQQHQVGEKTSVVLAPKFVFENGAYHKNHTYRLVHQHQHGGQQSWAQVAEHNAPPHQANVVHHQEAPHGAAGGATTVQPYFFPSEQSFHVLTNLLKSARSTLDVCVFTITDDEVTRAIVAAKQNGVKVRVISDDEQSRALGSDVLRLHDEAGIQYKLDNRGRSNVCPWCFANHWPPPISPNQNSPAHMHHKFVVVDHSTILTGSYNWTKGDDSLYVCANKLTNSNSRFHSARNQNNENFIVIHNAPDAVRAYEQEFERLWAKF
ncbi:LOW QUALITY PROTEIN: hypothetical protein BC938DRAFT_475398 [Jimgerdemannia flammicorona]|uniref:Mitochondrial cardiolipin hydrolase n=1 Tax=Jimgerdemannia flammicorona TaxID=994334 RepID=A0A433PVG5_9FUNG|nr:LOW QUALITY PROTEIN: hypothetical protein BC938DRAFT_475398 [Jimgerdemannia flammicorona]